jgi:ring-1,2-phenylacetyl-CoA epoxidase subunit PaaD
MREAIIARVRQVGAREVEVRTLLNPPWTSEWIRESARARIQSIGISPPPHHSGTFDITLIEVATCPHCGSRDTVLDNAFGPTPCRSLHFCNHCQQSFEQFKPL